MLFNKIFINTLSLLASTAHLITVRGNANLGLHPNNNNLTYSLDNLLNQSNNFNVQMNESPHWYQSFQYIEKENLDRDGNIIEPSNSTDEYFNPELFSVPSNNTSQNINKRFIQNLTSTIQNNYVIGNFSDTISQNNTFDELSLNAENQLNSTRAKSDFNSFTVTLPADLGEINCIINYPDLPRTNKEISADIIDTVNKFDELFNGVLLRNNSSYSKVRCTLDLCKDFKIEMGGFYQDPGIGIKSHSHNAYIQILPFSIEYDTSQEINTSNEIRNTITHEVSHMLTDIITNLSTELNPIISEGIAKIVEYRLDYNANYNIDNERVGHVIYEIKKNNITSFDKVTQSYVMDVHSWGYSFLEYCHSLNSDAITNYLLKLRTGTNTNALNELFTTCNWDNFIKFLELNQETTSFTSNISSTFISEENLTDSVSMNHTSYTAPSIISKYHKTYQILGFDDKSENIIQGVLRDDEG